MEFKQITARALEIRTQYEQFEVARNGKAWTNSQIMEGLVGDVGDLMKIVMAKEGARDMENVDTKLKQELSDCLWVILVLAQKYNVDIEQSFMESMDDIEQKLDTK
jgi:NTP pyrophosphatase (non-canonical NTP hydrolase)